VAIRYDVSVNWYTSPRIITVAAPSTEITIQDLVDTCRYLEEQFSNMSYPHLINAAGKEPLGGGVTVGITATLQNAILQFEGRTCLLTSGTATENDAKGITLTAAGSPNGDFVTVAAARGDIVYNATTGTMAAILAIDSEDQLTSQPLTGCSTGAWTIGDVYHIFENTVCFIDGGNLVAVDENDAELDPVFSSPYVNVVRTASSSATTQNLEAIQSSVFAGEVVIDVAGGTAGTEFPIGTHEFPSNNLTDAKTIADERGIERFHVEGALTIDRNMDEYRWRGQNANLTTITVGVGGTVVNGEFVSCYLDGPLDNIIARECVLADGLSNVSGYIYESGIEGTIYPHPTEILHIFSSYSLIPGTSHPHIDLTGVSSLIGIRDYSGGLGFTNADSNPTLSIDVASGTIHIHDTCSSGIFNCRGVAVLNDNTVGISPRPTVLQDGIVNKAVIADQVWDEDLADHTVTGSAGATVTDIDLNLEHLAKFSTNRSYIDGTAKTLTIYDDDGTTPLAVFDLLDSTATPSVTQIFERLPKGSP